MGSVAVVLSHCETATRYRAVARRLRNTALLASSLLRDRCVLLVSTYSRRRLPFLYQFSPHSSAVYALLMEVPGRMFGFTNIKLSDDLPLFWWQSSVCRAFSQAIRLCTYKFSTVRVRSCELPLTWGSSGLLSRSIKMKIRKSSILPVVLYHSSVRTVCIRTSTEIIIIIIWWWCQPLMSAIEAGGCCWRTDFGLKMRAPARLLQITILRRQTRVFARSMGRGYGGSTVQAIRPIWINSVRFKTVERLTACDCSGRMVGDLPFAWEGLRKTTKHPCPGEYRCTTLLPPYSI
jgi:hypothetical protein